MDVIPPINNVDDLINAVTAAADNENARWYIAKKADSLRRLDVLPAEWELPAVTAANREFSQEVRERYAKEGIALSDGSFPIPDRDALRRAIQSIGRASNQAQARRHIIKRARALDATNMLPDEWSVTASGSAVEAAEDLELERVQMEKDMLMERESLSV